MGPVAVEASMEAMGTSVEASVEAVETVELPACSAVALFPWTFPANFSVEISLEVSTEAF